MNKMKLLVLIAISSFLGTIVAKTTVSNHTPFPVKMEIKSIKAGETVRAYNLAPGGSESTSLSFCRKWYRLYADTGNGMQLVIDKPTHDCAGREVHVYLKVDAEGNNEFFFTAGMKA